MRLTRAAACAILALSFTSEASFAQDLSSVQAPAEFPPSGFQGRQYVDSRGCVFIRAGIEGSTTWVPRVTRTRELICGQTPSVPRKVAAVSRPAAVDAAVSRAAETPNVAQADAAAPKPVARPKRVAPKVARQPKPVTRQAKQAAVKAVPERAKPAGITEQRPLTGSPYSLTSVNQRVLPGHVYRQRLSEQDVKVPKGYEAVWQDDRLNPRRAEQTLAGNERMKLVWTSTVPRRLVDQSTGRDVTAKLPLVYPFTDEGKQAREFGKVTLVKKDGKLVKRIQRKAAKAVPSKRQDTRAVPASVTGRYVQVGAFAAPKNAQTAARKLQKAGLPAKIGKATRGGRTLQFVVAGPFAQDTSLQRALHAARRAGFADAFVRK